MKLGSHVLPRRQTYQLTPRLASVLRTLQQFKQRVQPGPTSSTSFGMKAEPPALPRWDDVLVDKGAAVPKPCLSLVEMHILTSAGDLLPASKASTATGIIFYQSPFWFCPTKEIYFRTTVQYAMDYYSFWKMKVLEKHQSKLWCSILAVLQVVCAPARFWEPGAYCFVERFSFGRRIIPFG